MVTTKAPPYDPLADIDFRPVHGFIRVPEGETSARAFMGRRDFTLTPDRVRVFCEASGCHREGTILALVRSDEDRDPDAIDMRFCRAHFEAAQSDPGLRVERIRDGAPGSTESLAPTIPASMPAPDRIVAATGQDDADGWEGEA